MTTPHLGLGLAPPPPPSTDPPAVPPTRRAPRLAKRRHAATASRSRAQPSTSAPSWNPFGGGGGTDASGQDGTAPGPGTADGAGGSGFRKGQSEGFLFGPAPTSRQQPPQPPPPSASTSEAPFVFGSVRDSLPRFSEGPRPGSDASGQDGTAPRPGTVDGAGGSGFGKGQSEGFMFGSAPTSRQQPPQPAPPSTSSSEAPFVFGSVRDSLPWFSEGPSAASKLDDMMGKMNLRSPGNCSAGVGKEADRNDKTSAFGAAIPSSASGSEASVLPERLTQLHIGTGEPPLQNEGANGVPETFVFGGGGARGFSAGTSTASSSRAGSHASGSVQVAGGNAVPGSGCADGTIDGVTGGVDADESGAGCGADDASVLQEKITQLNIGNGKFQYMRDGGTASEHPAHVNQETTLPEKMTKLNIQHGIPSQSMKDEPATRQPEQFVFGSIATPSSSLKATPFFVVGSVKENGASAPAFSFQSKAEATPGYGTPLNRSSSFSTSANEMPSFSSNHMNAGRGGVPGESCAVQPDQASCSRESLFGIEYIKSAYRDKKEAHKSTRKKKRPTRLKQPHQVSQETCTNGPNSDLTGDYSPMDCSPYQAAVEQVSREASVGSDQSIHILDSSVLNQKTRCAEDDLVSATEHLVIDADLPTYHDEGRDPAADASESNFGTNVSSFVEETNFCDVSQPLFTNMSIDPNGVYTTEAWVDRVVHNMSGQACKENTSSMPRESVGPASTQSSSGNLSGLNFTFGASSTQRQTTKRKLRTKGSQVPKPSVTHASLPQKSSQFSPESETENSVKEHLETCETWRSSGNQAYANGHFATAEGFYTRGINSISQYGTSGRCSRALMLCYSNRAATRMSLGRMREALQDCTTATSIDPTFLKAKVRSANCQLALGDLEGASSNYTACLKSSNTADFNIKISAEASDGLERIKRVVDWISQSRELLKKRTLSEAKTALEFISSALEISPHSDNLMEMKAEALLMLQRYEEVIELCQETVDLANANGERNNSSVSGKAECSGTLWRPYLICKSYFLQGKLEEALELLKRHELVAPVIESDGSASHKCFSSLSTSIRQLLSFKAAGNESFQARRYSEAVEQYSAALACNSDSRPFSAVCFCNRAAAYQALGQLTDAIADCSLAMVLDANYPKAISRRATLYEMIRDYGQSANDLRKLISLIQKLANDPGVSPKVVNKHSDLKQARARLLSVENEARKDTPLNFYLILGLEPSCSPPDIKKAYRKAALRHHPDKATQLLVRNENTDDGFWRDVAKEVYSDADHLFKTIGEAYNILSDPNKREEYDIEENIRNASRRAFKSTRQPEQHYSKQYDRGFSPRQWQSAGQSNKGVPRPRWSGYEYSDDYW